MTRGPAGRLPGETVAEFAARRRAERAALRVEIDGRMVAVHLPAEMHGRVGTYGNHGCRCTRCTAGWTQASRDRRFRRAQRVWEDDGKVLT